MEKSKIRKILIVENMTILISTLLFSKLIIFNKYKIANIAVKVFFTYIYAATLEPMVILAGWYTNKRMKSINTD